MSSIHTQGSSVVPTILTIKCPLKDRLFKKTKDIDPDAICMAEQLETALRTAIAPHMPAAGLAATQIGAEESAFVYSFDRRPENLKAVFNPSFEPIGSEMEAKWEGCFSTILGDAPYQIAKVSRYKKILVRYLDSNALPQQEVLSDFEARVFQHECDHLNGIVNIYKDGAEVKTFSSREELCAFMVDVKKKDAESYKNNNI